MLCSSSVLHNPWFIYLVKTAAQCLRCQFVQYLLLLAELSSLVFVDRINTSRTTMHGNYFVLLDFLLTLKFWCTVQFARSTEENEDKKGTTNIGDPLKALQVHWTAESAQETVIPSGIPHGAEAEQCLWRCRLRVLPLCCGSPPREWPQPGTLCKPN